MTVSWHYIEVYVLCKLGQLDFSNAASSYLQRNFAKRPTA
jgi:hypothetical protein